MGSKAAWTPKLALRYAWYCWLVMLVIPFLVFLGTVWSFMSSSDSILGAGQRPNMDLANGWFIASVAYMVLIVPASFFVRSRFFRGYWRGECVSPRDYFKGMMTVWVALEIGGLLSLAGCIMSRAMAPCILPSLVAFMMFVAMWPSGRAMVCLDRGVSDDPEKYEEPR
jgi:hypothetical protein